jgi:hypothetical protein
MRSLALLALASLVMASTGSSPKPGGEAASCVSVPEKLPAKLVAREGLRPALEVYASGTQTYTCALTDAGVPAWSGAVPSAELRACDVRGPVVGTHSAGPTWAWVDGSQFVGDKSAANAAPSPDDPVHDVAWLAIPKKTSSDGALGRMVFVQRVNTSGGVIFPDAGCDLTAANGGRKAVVPYHANYIFYEAR